MTHRLLPPAFLRILCLSFFITSWVASASGVGALSTPDDKKPLFEELNFTFEQPGWPWSEIPATTMGEDTTLAYRKSINDAYFIIIAEKIGVEYGINNELLTETAMSHLRAVSPVATFSDTSIVEINGLPWVNFTGKAKLLGQDYVYGYLVCTRNGYSYQLMTWRSGTFPELAKSDILELGELFKQIDPERIYHSEDFEPLSQFEDPAVGFSIDLGATGWTTWQVGDEEFPQAVFTATQANEVFLFAVPLYHEGLNPSFKDLKNSLLLSLLNIDASSGLNGRDKIVRQGEERFLQSSFTSENVEGFTNSFVIQVRKFKDFSYLLGGYSGDPEKMAAVESALAAVRISEEIDVEALASAMALEVKYFQAQTLNQLAVNAYSQSNYVLARRYLQRSLSLDKSDPAVASNFAIVTSEQGDHQAIVDLFEASPDAFEENYPFLEYYAAALAQLNRDAESEAVFNTVFDSSNMSESGLWSYMELLGKQERWKDGIAIARDFSDLTGSLSALQWAASYHSEIGDHDQALEILQELKENNPFELSLDYDIAYVYLNQEKYAKTIEYIEALGDDVEAYPLLLTIKGNALFGLKSYLKAKECYARAVELNPLDEEAKSMLDYATLALGKGDTKVNQTPIEPVPMPEFLAEKAKAAEASPLSGSESVILYTVQSIHYEKEKVNRKTTTTKVAIRDDAGLDMYSTLSFTFDPFYEDVYVNEIIVRDADGEVIGREERSDFYLLDNNGDVIVSQDRLLYAPVSGLTKNCTLEYTVSYNTTGLIEEFPMLWQSFTYFQKSLFCGVSITGDIDSVAAESSEGVDESSDSTHLIWYAENTPSYQNEDYQADIETFAPHLVLAEKSLSWESEVERYFEDIAERLTTSEAIKALSQQLTAEADSEEAKIAAVYGFIQKEFTYKALAFGPRAQIPNTADKVVADKYGDCKDLALLANRLLDALGIRSNLALVNTAARIKTELPSLDQFDHMILYLPDYAGGHFIDCTSQHVSLKLSTPIGLDGRNILVLEEGAPRFVVAKDPVLEENTISSSKRLEIVDDSLHVEETLRFTGLPAAYFRSYLVTLQESQTLDTFQAMMSSRTNQNLRLESVDTSNLKEVDAPLEVVMSYNIPRAVKRTSRGLTLPTVPAVWEHYYLGVPFARDRKTPFKVRHPISFESKLTLLPPEGLRLSQDDLANIEKDTGYHRYRHRRLADEETGQISVSSVISQLLAEGPRERFDSFQTSAQDALSLVSESLDFERVP
ncbi:DUF3857 domain-containing protein [Pelagicoccus sp. SDUM812005]|uniref:DUF3857 domain-containing protein n=1 Tax=Pelagicoccus sp. SDUM812005 TaxID=3041257 RepID=UPI00280C878E|nr:DUF3857 domain-containing protein [Pelagicoccus sp. SDUM812005]MDQ8183761.1 DUF3857 domain-containing protein [Pelagicoccus sp. SDUM812005]